MPEPRSGGLNRMRSSGSFGAHFAVSCPDFFMKRCHLKEMILACYGDSGRGGGGRLLVMKAANPRVGPGYRLILQLLSKLHYRDVAMEKKAWRKRLCGTVAAP